MRPLPAILAVGALLWVGLAPTPASAGPDDGELTIIASHDHSGDGLYNADSDTPQQGIDLVIADVDGTTVTGTTNADGEFVVPASSDLEGGRYRISASVPDDLAPLVPAPATAADNPSAFSSFTSFVDVSGGSDVTVRLGVWDPAEAGGGDTPDLITAIQNFAETDDQRAIVSVPWDSRGPAHSDSPNSPNPPITDVTTLASQAQVGTVFGLAVDRQRGRIFSAAFAKRHTAYGPAGAGGIYVTALDGSSTAQFLALSGTGDTAHTAPAAVDGGFFGVPGKESLGDIELSADGNTLYVVNQNNKRLYAIDATGDTGAEGESWEIPNPDCSAADDWRPTGLGLNDGTLYVGGVCSAQSSGSRSDLQAVVYSFDGDGGFTEVYRHGLGYDRGGANDFPGMVNPDLARHWNAWRDDYNHAEFSYHPANPNMSYPQPMLSGLAFESDGSLILGFRDRFGDQTGNRAPGPNNEPVASGVSGGDLIKVCAADGGYSWEGEGGCPNNNDGSNDGGQALDPVEYFAGDWARFEEPDSSPHQETAQGSVVLVPSQDEVASTALDPTGHYGSGGFGFFDRVSGEGPGSDAAGRGKMVSNGGFNKANGLADLEVLADQAATVQIGNRVWFDANDNGLQDPDELAIAGATVTLLDADGGEMSSATTSADGEYYFGGGGADPQLTPGAEYTVRFDVCSIDTSGLPGAPDPRMLTYTTVGTGDDVMIDSNPTPDAGNPCVADATVEAPDGMSDSVDHTIDAGIVAEAAPETCAIGDFVWQDTNRDGAQNDGEPGVDNATVTLLDVDGNPVDGVEPVTTGADGAYLFDDLECGTYIVQFEIPEGTEFTTPDSGDDAADSDPTPGDDPLVGRTDPVTLGGDEPNEDLTVDAGIVTPDQPETCSIGDYVWHDTNENGVQDDGEPIVAGAAVTLLDADGDPVEGVEPQTTGPDGLYLFDDLDCGTYILQFEIPEGTEFTTPDAGDDGSDSDPTPTDDPLVGRTDPVTVGGDQPNDDLTVDAGVLPPAEPTCSLGDLVWRDVDGDGIQDPEEPGVEGVTVELLAVDGTVIETVTTDAEGAYAFTGIECATYTVRFSDMPDGTVLTVQGQGDEPATDSNPDPETGVTPPVELTPENQNDPTVDAGIVDEAQPERCSLGDFVWNDADADGVQDDGEPGVEGVRVELLGADGTVVATVTTDAGGKYTFADIECATYTVRFSELPEGTSLTEPSQGEDPATDSNPDPETGVTPPVELTPEDREDPTVDAGLVTEPKEVCSIGDYVWSDTDSDGVQGDGERGVSGVTVELIDANGDVVASAKTDADGGYSFTAIDCGTYTVRFGIPGGTKFTEPNAGDDKSDSDPTPTGDDPRIGVTEQVTVGGDQPNDDPTVDAGVVPVEQQQPKCALGDYVWYDDDGDGLQDPEEDPVPGVTVTLLGSDGHQVGETATGADGRYRFTVACGDYTVKFSGLPQGYEFTEQESGNDSASDSNPNSAGVTGVILLTADHPENLTVDAGIVRPSGELPETGAGSGLAGLLVTGLLALGAGAFLLIRRRRSGL